MAKLIQNLPKMQKADICLGHDRREHEISVDKILVNLNKNFIASAHCRHAESTERILKCFSIRPVVLVRNIFDIFPSLYDHIKENPVLPMGYVPDEILLDKKEITYQFIAEMIIPWYLNFYITWYEVKNKLFLTYEELLANPEKTLTKVVDYVGLNCKQSDILESIEKAKTQFTRKNVGITGRGNEVPNDVKNYVIHLCKYYKDIDFSPIGIPLDEKV